MRFGGLEDAFEHRRDAGHQRDGPSSVGGEERGDVEPRQEDDGRGDGHAEDQDSRQAERVEEGEDAGFDLGAAFDYRHPGQGLGRVGREVPVGERHRLGHAGRAAGVDEHRQVVEARPAGQLLAAQGGGLADGAVEGQNAVRDAPAQPPALFARRAHRQAEQKPRDVGKLAREVDRQVGPCVDASVRRQAFQGLLPHDRDPRAVPVQLLAQLRGRCQRIVLGDRRPQRQAGVEGHDVLRAVGHDERDDVPGAHARAMERPGRLAGLMVELRVRYGPSEEVHGDPVRIVARRLGEEAVEGRRRLLDARRDARRVMRTLGGAIAHVRFLSLRSACPNPVRSPCAAPGSGCCAGGPPTPSARRREAGRRCR